MISGAKHQDSFFIVLNLGREIIIFGLFGQNRTRRSRGIRRKRRKGVLGKDVEGFSFIGGITKLVVGNVKHDEGGLGEMREIGGIGGIRYGWVVVKGHKLAAKPETVKIKLNIFVGEN